MKAGLYKGFSSYQFEYNKSFRLMDVQLVNRDLLNFIFTPLQTRVGQPTIGTRIPDLLMEPLDQTTLDIIETDLNATVDADPRVVLLGDWTITPFYDDNAVVAFGILNYIELNLQGQFDISLRFES